MSAVISSCFRSSLLPDQWSRWQRPAVRELDGAAAHTADGRPSARGADRGHGGQTLRRPERLEEDLVFQVQVQVGDEEPVGVDLPIPDADRPLLNEIIVDTCGSDRRR